MRKIIGIFVIISPLIATLLYAIYDGSVMQLLAATGIVAGIAATTFVGCKLLHG